MPPTIEVASLGMWDSLILMVMALVVFGPRRLPEIARKLGKIMYELRKASNDFKFEMEEELRKVAEADQRQKEEERLRALTPPASAEGASTTAAASQVQEPGAGTPVSGTPGQSPAPSPYPGEEAYPELTATTSTAPAEEVAAPIQPPSAGEPVPAAQATVPAENTVSAKSSEVSAILATDEVIPAMEPARHG
jgi:sec-independent protein translocase protein TatB